ncbi:amino acid-binding protein [Halorarum halophilum]|uniref:Amino acid-binding protein n=1 Tax=Halorarum halophilum TaxID=2743090 RepID=A0A7D5KVW6_9EURY|nr:amino acid-binding protein [Halobaculum halophilum]
MAGVDSEAQVRTIRLELVDEPGELLRALQPISENRGNLQSIFHERGNITPLGHIPVEVDVEATSEQFDAIVTSLREADINVVQAGTERYSESITLLLFGHLVDTGISDTLTQIRERTNSSITAFSLSSPEGTQDVSSARLRLGTAVGEAENTIEEIRQIMEQKDIQIIEPLALGGEA